ncbi:hypothetical protein IEQ_02148 [Bacillus cereus BAG6X1-2]|nr:hypothetical protein IEQ_02148 [Bacillus cereus BAG6X1-2]
MKKRVSAIEGDLCFFEIATLSLFRGSSELNISCIFTKGKY